MFLKLRNRATQLGPVLLAGIFTLATPTFVLNAQSAQPYSLQLAALATSVNLVPGHSTTGIGLEPQFRMNAIAATSKFVASLGVGGQWTSHSTDGYSLQIYGAFLEPRLLIVTSSRVSPYLSGRIAMLRQKNDFGSSSSGSAYGGGGGLAVGLTSRVNLDLGLALVRQQFGRFTLDGGGTARFRSFTSYAAKVGLSWGYPK